MKIFLRILLWLIIIIFAIPVFIFSLYFSQRLLGYYPGIADWKVAEIAAKKGDVSICKKIINPFPAILGPTAADARISCIHEYAKLTHDPSVCELLMPNSYGWDCIGAASDKEPCLMDFKSPPEVRGNGIAVPMSACKDGPKNITNNACCKIANIVFLDKVGTCSSLTESDQFKDQCFHESAIKNIDAVACTSILNSNIRTACEVEVRALGK